MRKSIVIFWVFLAGFGSQLLSAQTISLNVNHAKLEYVLAQITEQTGYSFNYSQPWVNPDEIVSLNVKDDELPKVLDKLFAGKPISYTIRDKKVFLTEKKTPDTASAAARTIKGVVCSASDGEPLIGATVMLKGQKTGVKTDVDGAFSLPVSGKDPHLIASYIGYVTREMIVDAEFGGYAEKLYFCVMEISRRKFLRTGALAAAGALAGQKLMGAADVLSGGQPPAVSLNNTPSFNNIGGKGLQLRFFPYELQLRHVFTVASYSRSTTPNVQVELTYDGVTGYGEASMPPYLAAELGTVASVCAFLERVQKGIGQFADPLRIDEILSWVDALEPDANAAAKAAVDIALHDLTGRLLGQPWHRLWGLSAELAPSTTYTIGIGDPDEVRRNTRECADRFNILKIKLGRDNDREMIRTVREITDLPLAVDVNQGWTDPQMAIDMIGWLAEQGVVMVEQPMAKDRLDDIARITEASPLPVFADESVQRLADIRRVAGAFSGINIKLMKCTGMREAHKMVTAARALGMKAMLGCMTETSCAVSAAAQLSPAVDFADLDGNLLIANDRFRGVTVESGRLTLPPTPGIGVELAD